MKNMSCIIWQQNDQVDMVGNPSKELFEKLLTRAREIAEYKDSQGMDFVKQNANHTVEKLISNNGRYHKKCYASFVNTVKVERARKRFSDSIESGESSIIKRKLVSRSTNNTVKSDKL